MEPTDTSKNSRVILETAEDVSLAAIRAPGLNKVDPPYIMTEIGSRLLLRDLKIISEDPSSPHREAAARALGGYSSKLAQMEKSEQQKTS